MLPKTLQIVLLVAIFMYYSALVYLLRKNSLNLRYTLLWLLVGLIMLVLVLFPGILKVFSDAVGIYSEMNALFTVISFCGIMLLISLTSIVSKMNDRVKQLTQNLALLEKRVREMKKESSKDEKYDREET